MEATSFDPQQHVLFEPVPQHELDTYRLQLNIALHGDQSGVMAADCPPLLLPPKPHSQHCNTRDGKEELDALIAEGFFNFDDEAYGVSTTKPHQTLSPGKHPAGPIAPMASPKQRVDGWMDA